MYRTLIQGSCREICLKKWHFRFPRVRFRDSCICVRSMWYKIWKWSLSISEWEYKISAGRSSHENRPAWIFFGQKKWQKSQISPFFQSLFGKLISVHFCSRELSQTPNGRIDNGKFFIFWYHIFHMLWISDQNMVSFAKYSLFPNFTKGFP